MGIKIVDVALGEYHTLALAEDGSVWTWGYAGKEGYFNWMVTQEVGALGHGDKKPTFYPKKVQFFADHGIKIKSISSGMYHCNALTAEGDLYTWGRGLYGVLGNASNQHALTPILNEDIAEMKETYGLTIETMDSADEYSVIKMNDGSLYAWGKNDKGQMGVPTGMGMDMIECENQPTSVEIRDFNDEVKMGKRFSIGQNTMIIQD